MVFFLLPFFGPCFMCGIGDRAGPGDCVVGGRDSFFFVTLLLCFCISSGGSLVREKDGGEKDCVVGGRDSSLDPVGDKGCSDSSLVGERDGGEHGCVVGGRDTSFDKVFFFLVVLVLPFFGPRVSCGS